MRIMRKSRTGRAFTLDEHQEISVWNSLGSLRDRWPRIELALDFVNTPEMLGVIEYNEIGPTMWVWAATWGIIVEPLSGGSYIYPTISAALAAVSEWAERIIIGDRIIFGNDPRS
jgi:hypothetical protein